MTALLGLTALDLTIPEAEELRRRLDQPGAGPVRKPRNLPLGNPALLWKGRK